MQAIRMSSVNFIFIETCESGKMDSCMQLVCEQIEA
jgi:hypothetical protein